VSTDRGDDSRNVLLEIWQRAVDAVNGAHVVERSLRISPPPGEVSLIALGKAAGAMARGAHMALGQKIIDGIVVTGRGMAEDLPWPVLEAAHPIPDESSFDAGRAIDDYVDHLPENRRVLVLLSGGASAMVEQPRAGITLNDLQRANRWLLGSGLDIHQTNAIRRRLSRFKGGGLAARLAPRTVRALAISDVPGDLPATIGSGPLTWPQDELEINGLPDFLKRLFVQDSNPAAANRLAPVDFRVVANNAMACAAAAREAVRRGWQAIHHEELLAGDAAAAGERLAQTVLDGKPGVVHIWGGETTVQLPEHPGRGGRCQHLALSAARVLSGRNRSMLLAVSTDGRDGSGDDAGALVDGDTMRRASVDGFEATDSLTRADSGRLLENTGDLIVTGPTGTNVMDLVLGLRL